MINISNNSNISNKRSDQTFTRTCFLTIDVESSYARSGRASKDKNPFECVEKLDQMLDIFKKHKVNATLFITGEVLERYPVLVKKWAKDFEIGCHNYYHQTLDKVDLTERERQIKDFVDLYKNLLARRVKGFRAPRNIIDNKQFDVLKMFGFLYDSSVFSRYPWPIQRYEGYKGRAPIKAYWPNRKDYRKRAPRSSGATSKLLEIPETPIHFWGLPLLNVPLVATWLRKWGVKVFKFIFKYVSQPKYISFNMHSWDGIKFRGQSSKNSGKEYLKQLNEMLGFLKKIGYKFKSGEQIYEEFCKNK